MTELNIRSVIDPHTWILTQFEQNKEMIKTLVSIKLQLKNNEMIERLDAIIADVMRNKEYIERVQNTIRQMQKEIDGKEYNIMELQSDNQALILHILLQRQEAVLEKQFIKKSNQIKEKLNKETEAQINKLILELIEIAQLRQARNNQLTEELRKSKENFVNWGSFVPFLKSYTIDWRFRWIYIVMIVLVSLTCLFNVPLGSLNNIKNPSNLNTTIVCYDGGSSCAAIMNSVAGLEIFNSPGFTKNPIFEKKNIGGVTYIVSPYWTLEGLVDDNIKVITPIQKKEQVREVNRLIKSLSKKLVYHVIIQGPASFRDDISITKDLIIQPSSKLLLPFVKEIEDGDAHIYPEKETKDIKSFIDEASTWTMEPYQVISILKASNTKLEEQHLIDQIKINAFQQIFSDIQTYITNFTKETESKVQEQPNHFVLTEILQNEKLLADIISIIKIFLGILITCLIVAKIIKKKHRWSHLYCISLLDPRRVSR